MLLTVILFAFAICEEDAKNATEGLSKNETATNETVKEDLPEVQIEKLYEPEYCDIMTDVGDKVKIHYIARLKSSGREFDNTYKRRSPYKVHIGEGRVIRGLEEGLLDMCIGEKRRITIPPELGYGKKGVKGAIPPNATLEYEVECLSFKAVPLSEGPMTAEERLEKKKEQIKYKRERQRYIDKELKKIEKQEKERRINKIIEEEGKANTDL